MVETPEKGSQGAKGLAKIEKQLKKRNLPSDKLLSWWEAGVHTEGRDTFIRENLRVIDALEKRRPGAASELNQQYGINDFARYPASLLELQHKEKNETEKPYGIILYPKYDPNNAFNANPEMFEGLLKSLQGKYALRVVEVETKEDIDQKLSELHERYGKINFAIIGGYSFQIVGGHGVVRSMQFGDVSKVESPSRYELHPKDFEGRWIQRISKLFVERPAIILASAEASVPGGIAEQFRKVFGENVIAVPNTPGLRGVPGEIKARFGKADSLQFDVKYE